MSIPLLLLSLNFGLGSGFRVDSPSFERDSVPFAPRPSEEFSGGTADARAEPSGALELNPLSVMFGKWGGNLELSLAPHQVLVISPAYFSLGNYFHGPEAELGYRFYFERRVLSGPFVGLGVLGAAFQYHPDSSCGSGVVSCSREDQATFLYGATFEAGWQWIVRDWLVLGAGAGVAVQHAAPRQRLIHQSDFTEIAELELNSGVRPRLLGTIGVVF